MRGEADPDATVTVNENPTFRLGAYYFGSDNFDNSTMGDFAELETYAALAQTDSDNEETDDLVSSVTNQVYLAQSPDTFAYDADGNQTLISTKTGLWRVTYNGENRPVRWVRDSDGEVVTMSYDHMGRRRTKNSKSFYYNDYLQVADNEGNRYIWDPTETTATRPLAWMQGDTVSYYTHDGNKNVSEVVSASGDIAAHYEYAPFGATILQNGTSASTNSWRFSSEYAEDDTATIYYNYRHYEPVMGRWLSRDPIEEDGGMNEYLFVLNNSSLWFDRLGMHPSSYYNKYDNPTIAARKRGRYINPRSKRESREYCGCVCKICDQGEWKYFTTQTAGTTMGCQPDDAPCPSDSVWVAVWHTHGDDNPSYDHENFSPGDIMYSIGRGIDVYLITPWNKFKQYIPGEGVIDRGKL